LKTLQVLWDEKRGVWGEARQRRLEAWISHLGWESFRYIALRLCIATSASRLIGIHGQAPEVSEIERLELRFRNDLRFFPVWKFTGDGHSQDVGI
jgi:hypothetical protein